MDLVDSLKFSPKGCQLSPEEQCAKFFDSTFLKDSLTFLKVFSIGVVHQRCSLFGLCMAYLLRFHFCSILFIYTLYRTVYLFAILSYSGESILVHLLFEYYFVICDHHHHHHFSSSPRNCSTCHLGRPQ